MTKTFVRARAYSLAGLPLRTVSLPSSARYSAGGTVEFWFRYDVVQLLLAFMAAGFAHAIGFV